MTEKVDFTKPIEAVNDDGRVYPATVDAGNPHGKGTSDQRWHVTVQGTTPLGVVLDDGTNWSNASDSWRIRNIQTKPSATDLEKANDLLREVIAWGSGRATRTLDAIITNARAYLATQSEPVDPDLLAAREIYEKWADDRIDTINDAILAGIKHGRSA